MTIEEFKAYTKTKGPLNIAEIHSLMDYASKHDVLVVSEQHGQTTGEEDDNY